MIEQENSTESPTVGRKRSDQSHQAILQATMQIIEEVGYRSLTIEAIAARAGVGKKTIYRWWSSKAAVALETLTAYTDIQVPFSDTGSLAGDLLLYFKRSFPGLEGNSGTLLRGLAAEAQLDDNFAHDFQSVFIVPRKAALIQLLERGIQRKEITPNTNLEVLADLIYGAKWYRFLLYPAPLDESFAQEIVTLIHRLSINVN